MKGINTGISACQARLGAANVVSTAMGTPVEGVCIVHSVRYVY